MTEESKEYFPDEIGTLSQLAIFSLFLDRQEKTSLFISNYFKTLHNFSSFGVVHIKNFSVKVDTDRCLVLLEPVEHKLYSYVASISAKVFANDVITIGLFCVKEPSKNIITFFETNGKMFLLTLQNILFDQKLRELFHALPNISLQIFESMNQADREKCFQLLQFIGNGNSQRSLSNVDLKWLSNKIHLSEDQIKSILSISQQIKVRN